MGQKNIYTTYFLFFIGGFAGLHLLYLGRDGQAFLYWCTFGGYFGVALLKDFYSIPHYVRDANNDPEVLGDLIKKMQKYKKPPFSIIRFLCEIIISNSWCYLWLVAMPENDEEFGLYFRYIKYLGPLAAALGTWMVGNVGRQKASFKWSVIGAFMVIPLCYIEVSSLPLSAITSTIMTEWKGKQWRRKPYTKSSICRRATRMSAGWLIFCTVWIMYLYFTTEVTLKDGQKIKIKHLMTRFFNSEMYVESKKSIKAVYEDAIENGLGHAFTNFMELMDPFGEYHALRILGLKKGLTQKELSVRYKALSKEWHPDRHKGDEEKKIAQQKFIEIGNAYGVLSTSKKRRKSNNEKSSNVVDEDFAEFDEEL